MGLLRTPIMTAFINDPKVVYYGTKMLAALQMAEPDAPPDELFLQIGRRDLFQRRDRLCCGRYLLRRAHYVHEKDGGIAFCRHVHWAPCEQPKSTGSPMWGCLCKPSDYSID